MENDLLNILLRNKDNEDVVWLLDKISDLSDTNEQLDYELETAKSEIEMLEDLIFDLKNSLSDALDRISSLESNQ